MRIARTRMSRRILSLAGIAAAALTLGAVGPALRAAPLTLSDQNASAVIDPSSQSGMSDWIVDGTDHMKQQWFWYRTSAAGPEASIDTLPVSATLLDSDADPGFERLNLTYTGTGFKLDVTYVLEGNLAGSYEAVIDEQLRITNTGASPLEFHLFQYSDYDLSGSPGNDTVTITGGNTATQIDSVSGGFTVTENAGTPTPMRVEAAAFNATLASLTNGTATSLNNVTGAGPGDVTWAFQWDYAGPTGLFRAIPVGQSRTIDKNRWISTIPEPSSVAVLALAGAGLMFRRKRAARSRN